MRGKRAICLIGLGLAVCGAMAALASGGAAAEFRGANSRQNTILQDPCPANEFPPIEIFFASVISVTPAGTTTGIRCITEVRSQGEPVRGVPIMLGGDLLDGDGNAVSSLPTRSGTTNRAGQQRFNFPYSVPPPGSQLGVIMEGLLSGDTQIDLVDTTCGIVQRQPCNNSSTQACHLGRRFKATVTVSGDRPATVINASKRESRFSFFGPGSTDLLVQLINRCSTNNHFWVFASSATSVPFELTVTDTFNGESRAYTNPGAFEPILDTAAFATCP